MSFELIRNKWLFITIGDPTEKRTNDDPEEDNNLAWAVCGFEASPTIPQLSLREDYYQSIYHY